ncbi:MAG TPA: alpha/beta hydrolase [Candidatus Saccharimonadales bacterium]
MENAVILHGKPSRERYLNPALPKPHEANWFPWIRQKLGEVGITAVVPPLPKPYFPVYEDWKRVFEQETVTSKTRFACHSAGAELFLRWFSSHKDVAVERAVLVAPYADYLGKYGDFSQYDLDPDLPKRVGKLIVINSKDDDDPIQRRTREIVEAFPSAELIEVDGYGHFRIGHNMTGPEFPILLEALTAS